MTVVIGLDLSLTATGIAMIDPDGEVLTHRVRSTGRKGATARETADRITRLRREINGWVLDEYDPDPHGPPHCTWLAVVESPSFGSKGGAAHERGGLWWGVVGELAEFNIPIATVAPPTRAKYASGSGRADKKEVLAAMRARHPQLHIPDDNVADAIALAAMGARHLGRPIDAGLPAVHLEAMAGAKWPS